MNALMYEIGPVSQNTDIFSVLGEPDDPNSDWDELKNTQLSGYDYVFISRRINKKLASKTSLSEFMLDIFQILETTNERTRVYIYSVGSVGKPEFASFDINWERGAVTDFRVRPVQSLAQKEFIRTIFDHSGLLGELA